MQVWREKIYIHPTLKDQGQRTLRPSTSFLLSSGLKYGAIILGVGCLTMPELDSTLVHASIVLGGIGLATSAYVLGEYSMAVGEARRQQLRSRSRDLESSMSDDD